MSEEKNLNNLNASEKAVNKAEKAKKKSKNKKGKDSSLKAFLKSRKARHGSVAIGIVIAVVAVVIVLNIICSLLVDRFPNIKIDMTANGSYALQEDTVDYVSHLSKDVKVTILMNKDDFESGGTYMVQAVNLLEKMESGSNGKLKLDYVDLTQNPTFTSKYSDVEWTNSSANYLMVVECGEQYKVLTLNDCFEYDEETYYYYGSLQITGSTVEQSVVTSILNVTTEDKVVVDMITGNNEQDYSAIKTLLEKNAYQVNEISLTTQDVEEDATVALLFAPSVDLDEQTVAKLSKWLDNDGKYGKTLFYVPTADMPSTPNLDELLNEWGMSVDNGYVFETSGDHLVSGSSPYAFLVDYTDYYTTGLKNASIPVVVSDSHAINVKDESKAHAILNTSTKAGIYPLDVEENWDYNDAITGEPICVAAEGIKSNTDEQESKLVVFGSYIMFNSNIMSFNSYNNSAYLMNVVNTVSGKDSIEITIETKSMESTELGVSDVATRSVIMVIFVIIVPIAVIVIGIVFWIRRRNK
ncbi:MAG: GldG family protein [Ruminococcus sp.]|nr:GldG family protein [Ruminococcus sp.]